MPWALRENLTLSGFPRPGHIDKYGYGDSVAMLTLCPRPPHTSIVMDDRMQWWKHIPLVDGQIKNLDDIVLARDTALGMFNAGHHVVIHCVAGRNRSGLVGALVLRELNNWSGEEALNEVRLRRPRSVDNDHFEAFLRGLERPR